MDPYKHSAQRLYFDPHKWIPYTSETLATRILTLKSRFVSFFPKLKMLLCSVSDPYSFFTDPNPDPDPVDPDGGQYGSGSGSNPDPGL